MAKVSNDKETPLIERGPSGVSADPKWESVESAWASLHQEPEGGRVFFDHIVIAADGGLSEIGEKPELWYSSRYFSSVLLLLFVVYNIYFIIDVDVNILSEHYKHYKNGTSASMEDDYLISKAILDQANSGIHSEFLARIHPKSVIAVIEMTVLFGLIVRLLWDVYKAIFRDNHDRWKAISEVFWEDLPDLSIYSAMKLLALVVPQKLSYDINYALWYAVGPEEEAGARKKAWEVLKVLLTRPFCLIIGMDCFLVKYRGASDYIMTDSAGMMDVMGGVIFLNQVLGVVNITYTIKSRLYRFVFGGEDGIMSDREVVRQDVWESFVAFKVFEKYPAVQACAMMLSWCDDDFQMLALNENAGAFNEHEKTAEEAKRV